MPCQRQALPSVIVFLFFFSPPHSLGNSFRGGQRCIQWWVVYSPSENQTQQGADEDEHLVEHGRVGPLDGTVEIILKLGKELLDALL